MIGTCALPHRSTAHGKPAQEPNWVSGNIVIGPGVTTKHCGSVPARNNKCGDSDIASALKKSNSDDESETKSRG